MFRYISDEYDKINDTDDEDLCKLYYYYINQFERYATKFMDYIKATNKEELMDLGNIRFFGSNSVPTR